jgi:hypothetical protein
MKLFYALIAASLVLGAAGSNAQTTPAAGATAPQQTPAQPGGKVIFSRSIDENGQTTTQAGPAAPDRNTAQLAKEPSAQDAEREAITFTDFDMDVHLRPIEQHIAVRALITVRNDSKSPIAHIPLQLSSSLNWERIRLDAHDLTFPVATLNSDTDHTGQLHEAAITLAQPLAPGQTLQFDVSYSGTIAPNAQRLLAIGTPQDVALHSDWDEISVPFTGLRGFGNVVWYPASSVPVILGDGARLFDEVGEHKLRVAGARFKMRLAVESPHGRAPTVALVNGHMVALTQTPSGSLNDEVSDITQAESPAAILGFEAPSLFVAIRSLHSGANTFYWILPENEASLQAWASAVDTVTPFLKGWLGKTPRSNLNLLDLPDPQDAPYETGALLATSIRPASPDQLEGILAHALTHAWVQSPRAWLSEGVAHFMGTLWVEKQRGRDQALGTLEASRASLAIAEPESPGQSSGQPLAQAISPVYYRTKATYVLWMLRDIAGDPILSAALRAYDPAADVSLGYGRDTAPGTFQMLLEHAAGAAAERSTSLGLQAGTQRDLKWFFADWVDADKGLPDLSIESVFPSQQPSGSWVVAINLNNAGYAAAEVPVVVRGVSSSVTRRLLIPARGKISDRILLQEMPTQVQLNDGTVPETQASVHIKNLEAAAGNSASSPQSPQP